MELALVELNFAINKKEKEEKTFHCKSYCFRWNEVDDDPTWWVNLICAASFCLRNGGKRKRIITNDSMTRTGMLVILRLRVELKGLFVSFVT